MSTHRNDKPFTCFVCDRTFARVNSLSLHVKTHSDSHSEAPNMEYGVPEMQYEASDMRYKTSDVDRGVPNLSFDPASIKCEAPDTRCEGPERVDEATQKF